MKFVLSLLVILSLASCGDGNVTSTGSSSDGGTTTYDYNPAQETQYISSFSEFRTQISAGQFIQPGFPNNTDYDNYRFMMVETTGYCSIGSNGFSLYQSGYGSGYERALSSGSPYFVLYSDSAALRDYTSVINIMLDIVDSAVMNPMKVGNAAYQILTDDDIVYTIDLNVPLLANPKSGFDCNSDEGFLSNSYQYWNN